MYQVTYVTIIDNYNNYIICIVTNIETTLECIDQGNSSSRKWTILGGGSNIFYHYYTSNNFQTPISLVLREANIIPLHSLFIIYKLTQ